MNVVVDGLLTNYRLTGKGRLVLLLHGWGDDSTSFDSLIKRLGKQYKTLAVDLPGFGGTETPREVWDLDDYARFVGALLAKLDLQQPFAVIGHSNGGALAVRAISIGALKPGKLVLLAASGVRTNNKVKRFILKIIAKVGNVATLWLPERYRQALRKSLYGVAGSDMLVAPQLEDTFRRTVRQDVQADAVVIDIPTLLIYAADDDAIPLADGRQYKELIKNSRLEVIRGAGHFIHHDQPQKVAESIEEFLK